MKRIIISLLCLGILASLSLAVPAPDKLVLKDGRVFEGDITLEDDKVIFNNEVLKMTFKLSEVSSFEFGDTPNELLAKKIASLDGDNVKQVFDLIDWSKKKGIKESQIGTLYQKVLEIEPENIEAHRGLGHVKFDGKWLPYDNYMIYTGHIKTENGWMTLDEAADVKAEKLAATEVEELQKQLTELFSLLGDKEAQRVSQAFEGISAMENQYPGITHKARQARNYFAGLNEDQVVYDGKNTTVEMRFSQATINWDFSLTIVLSLIPVPVIVTLQLPRQLLASLKTTIIIPG
ncbi:hypothetical protein ACFL54_09660 [Planctomycetota bacterium]